MKIEIQINDELARDYQELLRILGINLDLSQYLQETSEDWLRNKITTMKNDQFDTFD